MKYVLISLLAMSSLSQSVFAENESNMASIFGEGKKGVELTSREMQGTIGGAGLFVSQWNANNLVIQSQVGAYSNGFIASSVALGVITPTAIQTNIASTPQIAPVINIPAIRMPSVSVCGVCR